jgi:hypothetical protein
MGGWYAHLMRAVTHLLALVLALPLPAAAQDANAMVVIVKGGKQFHQPGCAVVAKAGANVTVAKRGEATRRGLTAHDCGVPAPEAAAGDPNLERVATQPGDNKYHRTSCEKLGAKRSTLTLDAAGRTLWPCPVCKPPIRQRKPVPDA